MAPLVNPNLMREESLKNVHTYKVFTFFSIVDPNYNIVKEYVINPKSVSLGELYGEFDLNTNEWTDGILSSVMRVTCSGKNACQLLQCDLTPVIPWEVIFPIILNPLIAFVTEGNREKNCYSLLMSVGVLAFRRLVLAAVTQPNPAFYSSGQGSPRPLL